MNETPTLHERLAVIWTIGGIAFGCVMTKFIRKQPDNVERTHTGP